METMNLIRRTLGDAARRLITLVPSRVMQPILSRVIAYYARSLSPEDGLRFLFGLDRETYHLEGRLAIEYGGGVHTKHRHIRYHDFFIERIQAGEHVLDIGCGKGELAFDIAQRSRATVYGIDIDARSIRYAQETYQHPGLTFALADAARNLPDGQEFSVIVLSNVLEHIEDRAGLLRRLSVQYRPRRVLIRVPSYERDWRVPLHEELGIDYRLDPTHYIEYRQAAFREEMAQAGLDINELRAIWGELWVAASPCP